MFSLLLAANPSYADFQVCPNPTPEARILLEQCSGNKLCRAAVSATTGCTSLVNAISSFFRKPPLDAGEFKTERYPEPDASDRAQARKNNERDQQNKIILEANAKDAFLQLRVLDDSVKRRLATQCGDPLDQLCKDAVYDAQKVLNGTKTFNGKPDFVEIYGIQTFDSPRLAAPYEKIQDDAWNAAEKLKADRNKKVGEPESTDQNSPEAQKARDAETIRRNLAVVQEQERKRELIRAAAQKEQEQLAADQRARNALAAQQRAAQAREAEKDAQDIRDGVGKLVDAIGKYQKAKQDAQRPAASPAGSDGRFSVCTPGNTYDARKCSCALHQRSAGC